MLSYCSNLINDYLEILIRQDIFKWSLSEVISSIENVSKFVAVVIDIVCVRIIAVGNGKTLNAEALLAVAELYGYMPPSSVFFVAIRLPVGKRRRFVSVFSLTLKS